MFDDTLQSSEDKAKAGLHARSWFVALAWVLCIVFHGQAFAQGTWATMAPMQTPRGNQASGVVNGLLYTVGGGYQCCALSSMEAYNPSTNTWSYVAPLPIPIDGMSQGQLPVVNGLMYVVAGHTQPDVDLATLFAYDPVANTWTAKASLPKARSTVAAVAVNGIIYALGGNYYGAPVYDVDAYDPTTDSWTAKPSLPPALNNVGAVAAVNGIIYLLESSPTPATYAYDPSTGNVTSKAPIPVPFTENAAAGVINGIIYVVGGSTPSGQPLNTVQAYNPATDSWTEMAPMPTARFQLSSGVIGNLLYAVGGTTSPIYYSYYDLATNEVFNPILSVQIEIKPPATAPVPINLSSAGVVPVAILSTSTFDATQVDPATVSLAGAEVQMIGKSDKYSCSVQDVNGDGLNDLVCQVSTAQFLIQPGQSNAVLQAKTLSGQPIQGQEAITIVPQ